MITELHLAEVEIFCWKNKWENVWWKWDCGIDDDDDGTYYITPQKSLYPECYKSLLQSSFVKKKKLEILDIHFKCINLWLMSKERWQGKLPEAI